MLNISRDASSSQVKKGYHKAALVWHPDKHSDKGPEVRPPPAQPATNYAVYYATHVLGFA